MLRSLSVAIRKAQSRKEIKRGLATFTAWQQQIAQLPAATPQQKLLIIRLDDIGDYLLFRNTLPAYRAAYPQHHITLLGNTAWKSIFEATDSTSADETIWISKNKYFDDPAYRISLWADLRTAGYQTVICPSRARPMLLDDCCMLAAEPTQAMASHNELLYPEWNKLSDTLYTRLCPERNLIHEFHWNIAFATWATGMPVNLAAPHLPLPLESAPIQQPYIVCFVGGSKKSHRWPAPQWVELVKHITAQYHCRAVIAGGATDKPMADAIALATDAINIAGTGTLLQTAQWMQHATAIITNDTMSSHMAVSLGRPTLIIANGDNFYKFCGYKEAHIGHANCVYPPVFLHAWKKHHYKPFRPYIAVTKDIATITPAAAIAGYNQLIKATHI